VSDLRTEPVPACPACGSSRRTAWRTGARDWEQPAAPRRYDYWTCGGCGAHYLGDRPVVEELQNVYFEGYLPYEADGRLVPARAGRPTRIAGMALYALAAGLERLRPDGLQARLDAFYRPAEPGLLLLDYGCGSTAYLDVAAAAGWDTIGADFAPAIIAAIAAHGHRGVLIGEPFSREVEDRSVELVRMNHVMEHLYEPAENLREIRRKLRPGGRIHIATPNAASLSSQVFKTRWFGQDCPRHAALYSPAVLRALMLEWGFRDVSVAHEVATKDLARSWGIARFERGRLRHEEIYGLAADPHRARVLAPAAKIAALAGRADRFHLFATA
jgi:SAM-dependent methyltransferase